MANPQTENGHVRIANELFDQIINADLSLRELKIIFTVIRFTYGFNRKEAELSIRFISDATGIKFQNIASSIKHLQNKNILFLDTGNHKQGRKIILNKNYESWNLNSNQKDDGSIIKNRHQKNDGFAQKDDGCVIEKMTETVIEKMTKKVQHERQLKDNFKDKELSLIQSHWNSFAEQYQLPKILQITKKRLSHIKARMKEPEFDFNKITEKIKHSDFLLGKNNRGWKVDFDFIISSKDNYLKILEGKYETNGTYKQQAFRGKGSIDPDVFTSELNTIKKRNP